jgi:hypothetical protein
MTLLFETPQDYYDYFHNMMLNAKPPNPEWKAGFEAARRWREYHERQDTTIADPEVLISLIKFFMPHRSSGSAFGGLWANVLSDVSQLPVRPQISAWREVFDVSNQGEKAIGFSEQASRILKRWLDLVDSTHAGEINQVELDNMADATYKYYPSNVEWTALTRTLDHWFRMHLDKPTLLELIHAKEKSGKSS